MRKTVLFKYISVAYFKKDFLYSKFDKMTCLYVRNEQKSAKKLTIAQIAKIPGA